MRKAILLGALGATLIGGGIAFTEGFAQDRDADWTRADTIARADRRFARLDANGDGTISKDEFRAPMLARFDRMDADHNGTVTRAERDAARAERRERDADDR